jgi:hypothetical protein
LEQLLTLPMDILTSRDGYRYRLTVLCMLACTCHSLRVATLAERTTRTGTLRLRCSITGPVDYMIWSMLAGVDDRRIWRAILVNHYLATGSFGSGTLFQAEPAQSRGTNHVHTLIHSWSTCFFFSYPATTTTTTTTLVPDRVQRRHRLII